MKLKLRCCSCAHVFFGVASTRGQVCPKCKSDAVESLVPVQSDAPAGPVYLTERS